METIGEFTQFLLEAHHVDGKDDLSPPLDLEYQIALRAGAWAETFGWTMSIGALLSPSRNCSISASGGVITVDHPGWKTREYPTESLSETLDILVLAGVLPWIYSSMAGYALSEYAGEIYETADGCRERDPARAAELSNRAEAAEFWLSDKHLELGVYAGPR